MVLPGKSVPDEDTDESDEERLPSIQLDDVTVAIFCALAYESVAVKYTFDEHFECVSKTTGGRQNYVYSFGRIAEHNIVLARPVQMGPVNAAQCAATVSQQFPNVRLALMVGIGAGIPSDKLDIRLGDVAVSVPNDNHPGVLEYDFGKYEADGEFVQKGSLNTPPRILVSAIGSLEEDELMDKTPIKRILKRITKQPRFGRPGSDDILFDATFPHVQNGSDCTACRACPDVKVMPRDERPSAIPVTHRGLILSGGGVIKNTDDRERLRRGYQGAVCFEMEAAGIMNEIPCLVIRGICDYADTHKQDGWHYYAAAAAAAYCKAVLLRVPGEEVKEIRPMKEIMDKDNLAVHEIHQTLRETYATTQALHANDHLDKIRSWLSSPDPSTNLNKAREQHHKGTGQWFLHSDQYSKWKTERNSFLWLNGIPGCGKTILSSSIVTDLEQSPACESLIYFYFDFNDIEKQSLEKAVRSLITQLYYKRKDTRAEVDTLYSLCDKGGRRPDALTLYKVFQDMLQKVGEVWLILDALDECYLRDTSFANGLLPWIKRIRGSGVNVHMLVTSRPEYDIKAAIEGWACGDEIIPLQSSRVEADIKVYIKFKINQVDEWRTRPDIQKEIEDALIQKANGMFRWVSCQFDILTHCLDRPAIRRELANLPRTLDATYARILSRVQPEHMRYTTRLLQFLAYSERPLRLDEAVDALAVDTSSQPRFDAANRTVIPEKIATYCAGLVILVKRQTEDNGTTVTEIQLAHFSVQEYLTSGRLEGNIAKYLQETAARLSIVNVSLSYLQDINHSYTLRKARQKYPLAQYSARYWAENAVVVEGSDKSVSITKEYFSLRTAFEFGYQLYRPDRPWDKEPDNLEEPVTCLYYASVCGLLYSTRELLENGANVNAQGGDYGNALQAASFRGHKEIVQTLLENGANVNAQGGLYGNALYAASFRGHKEVAQLLRASAIATDFAHSPKAEKRDADSDFDLRGRKRKKAIY
ncbi:hypothetical protein PG993_008664 [Apiospora rasikravindrae]|uniref:NACHT domain-containing protein n=1 Tax=Apiospora rasikravindrae TaxID=990691 RepID=A0ABR1SS47_9PEZI